MVFTDKKVFITGGDRGIGKEIVKVLIDKGVQDFAIMSRSLSGIDDLKETYNNVNFKGFKGDVSNVDDISKIIKQLENDWNVVDILINNAGVVSAGSLEDISDDDIVNQINVNLTGPILLTKYFLPLLKKSDAPQLINLSSGLGLIGMPFYSVYASTKAGIRQFSDAIRREYRAQGLHVLCIYPTATDTDMMTNSQRDNMDSPEMVAKKSIEALENGKINIVFGGKQREKDALYNFVHPEEMDKDIQQKYEKLKEATKDHRSM